jgi:DNA-binding transcriptional LysR family regulator
MSKRNDNRRYVLPALDLLPTFEAAARTLSFTKAADELFLTQSAVSKQVKQLEDQLGLPLFERKARALTLSGPGRALHAQTIDVLDRLQATVDMLQRETRGTELTVTMTTGFASMWLIPRLGRFTARHPNVHVRISATTAVLDMQRDRIDVAIRFCPPHMVSADCPRLFGEETVPVCSPRLLEDPKRPLRHPADLVHHTLLRYDVRDLKGPFMDWDTWLTALGLADLQPAGAHTFNQTDQVIQAAIAGQGVALGQSRLVAGLIAAGTLVAPFGPGVPGERAFFVVRSEAADRPTKRKAEIDAFVEWLIEEARSG